MRSSKTNALINTEVETGTGTETSPFNSQNFLSPQDLDAIRKSPENVNICWIEKLDRYVYCRTTSAKSMRDFLNLSGTEVPKADMIDCLAGFVSDTLCNKDGSDFITFEKALTYSLTTLDDICSGIIEDLKSPQGKGKGKVRGGNASRR